MYGCKGACAMQRLPHHDRLTDMPVEPMHTLKDCMEHILKVIAPQTEPQEVQLEEMARRRQFFMREVVTAAAKRRKKPTGKAEPKLSQCPPYQLLPHEADISGNFFAFLFAKV